MLLDRCFQHRQQIESHRSKIKSLPEKLLRPEPHLFLLHRWQPQPLAEGLSGARHRVGMHQAGPSGGNFSRNIHWLSNPHRQATSQRFRHHDAEVLLMGGQAKELAQRKAPHLSSPLSMPGQMMRSAMPSAAARC